MLATWCSGGGHHALAFPASRGCLYPYPFLWLRASSGRYHGLIFHYLTCFPPHPPPLSTARSHLVVRTGSLDKEGTKISHLTFASCVWLLSFQITHQPPRRRLCPAPEPNRLYSSASWIYLFCGWASSDSAVTSSACWTNAKTRQENSTQDAFLWGP